MGLFAVVYVLLGAVWLRVLDDKLRRGPGEDDEPRGGGWLGAAAELADPAGRSFTEPREGA